MKQGRGAGRRFLKGVSGNPGGRPRAVLDVQALAREHTLEAVAALVKGLSDDRLYVSAANSLLDRGWGRATEHVQLDGTQRVTSVVLNIVCSQSPSLHGGETIDGVVSRSDEDAPRILTIHATYPDPAGDK
jgi:hypothetical protein